MIVNFSDVQGVNRLFQDYIYHYEKVKKFFQGDPYVFNNYRTIICKINKRKYNRDLLYSILGEENIQFAASSKALTNIELLKKNDTYVVVGGQQVGIFGGPLYTFYKAITIIKLAQKLAYELKKNVVPLFWLASDDHDFQETNHINIIDKNNQIVKLKYSPKTALSALPMYSINLKEEIDELIEKTDFLTFDSEFKKNVLEELRGCYTSGNTISYAFGKWLAKVFANYGLVLIDPYDVRLKRLGSCIFKKEVEAHLQTRKILNKTNQELKNAGYHNQVECTSQNLNLFLIKGGRRVILKKKGGEFGLRGSDKKFSLTELKKLTNEHPESFSPNVLLRPLFQDYCLPTIAYVGGPNEIAYFAQLKYLYEFFDLTMPIIFPRASITLVEKKISKILAKQQTDPKEIFTRYYKPAGNFIKSKLLSKSLKRALGQTQKAIGQKLQKLKKVVINFDPNLKDILNKSSAKIQFELKWIEGKVSQAYKKEHEILFAQINKVENNLFPHQHLQERYLSWTPYLIKYGWDFINTVFDNVELEEKGHQILEIDYSLK